jgi:integrase
MANYKTLALSEEQYSTILNTIESGFLTSRPNPKVAAVLRLEANLGIRISDILELTLDDIVYESGRYRLDITEEKTGKKREFTVPLEIVEYIRQYNKQNNIKDNEIIFPITERAVQKHLHKVCDYLGYERISTHSFRKFFATSIYKDNDFDIVLVQKLLQHSSPETTQRYIGISQKQVEQALSKHIRL